MSNAELADWLEARARRDTIFSEFSDGQVLSSTIQERFLRMGKQARDFADE